MSQNVGMSSCCLSGTLHEGSPTGRIDTIGGLKTYIAEPKDGQKTKSLIFISDSTPPPFIFQHLPLSRTTNQSQSLFSI